MSRHHVQSLTVPIGDLGGRWMLDPQVLAAGAAAGYPNGYAYYVAGRGGVLGDVDADVVVSAFGFFEPATLRKMWERGGAVEGPRAAARRYAAGCAEYLGPKVSGFGGLERFVELATKAATGIDPSGLALFAGWRAEPLPDEIEARAALLLHVLRELRGGVHLLAVVTSGLPPLDAVVVAGGVETAQRFGWREPFPEPDADRWTEAEERTDQILTGLYRRVLWDVEVAELAELVGGLAEHVGPR